LTRKDYHQILGVAPGATERQIKAAYRRLALRYHPDLNDAADAGEKFNEINRAYEFLLKHGSRGEDRAYSHDDAMAREVFRREREKMYQRARARRDRKKKEEEFFNRPEWHDPLLVLNYLLHGFAVLFALASIIGPVVLVCIAGPGSLAGTSFFLVAGGFLLVYIYQRRKTWFRLGRLMTTRKEVAAFFRMGKEKPTSDKCCYSRDAMAGGKPYRIELVKIMEVRIANRGFLNHGAGYKNKVKRVVIPRSSRAHYFHRLSSLVKVLGIIGCMLFLPFQSLLWRFMAGILAGGGLSLMLLGMARVRAKSTYLLTPGLILKAVAWIAALWLISDTGPGFDIRTSGYVYLVVAGLLFFLDMAVDLIIGFLPFYRWLFKPLVRQGNVLDGLYGDGYQNYMELPVYSVLFPFFRWLF